MGIAVEGEQTAEREGSGCASLTRPSSTRLIVVTIDMSRGHYGLEVLTRVFVELCAVESPDDGLVFLPDSVQVEAIREDQEYGGMQRHADGHARKGSDSTAG